MALKHGGRAASWRFEGRAAEIAEEIFELLPVKSESDGHAVALLSLALARIESMEQWLLKNGWHDPKGTPRPVLRYLAQERRQAVQLLGELGLTPRSRAQLGVNLIQAGEAYRRHVADKYGGES